jgi:hypothetical protein
LKFQEKKRIKEKKRRFWRFAVARSEGGKKNVKITRFIILAFHCVAKTIEG